MCLQPVAGMLADRFGRKPMLLLSGVGVSLAAVPIFTMLGAATSPYAALALILIPITLHGGYTATNAMVKAELFPAHVRALGVAFPYAVGNTLLAGTTEYVALWFKSSGNESGFFWYVAVMVAMTVVAYLMLPETKTATRVQSAGGAFALQNYRFTTGKRADVELLVVDSGKVRAAICPTRGLSLWRATIEGLDCGWRSPVEGPIHPQWINFAEPNGLGWLDGFDELLVRCGLQSFGALRSRRKAARAAGDRVLHPGA